MEDEGKGNVEMENGEFHNVLYVLNLSSNLLSIYQITHLGDGHRVEFLPDSIQVQSLKDDSVVVMGKVNHDKRLYSFLNPIHKSNYGMSGMDIFPSAIFSNFAIKKWSKVYLQ